MRDELKEFFEPLFGKESIDAFLDLEKKQKDRAVTELDPLSLLVYDMVMSEICSIIRNIPTEEILKLVTKTLMERHLIMLELEQKAKK